MPQLKPWYNFYKEPYTGNDPFLFDRGKLDWIKVVESDFEVIRREMQQIIEQEKLTLKPYRFHESSTGKVEWQTIAFISWGYKFHQNCRYCPDTIKLLESIPGMVSVSLSRLEADSVIPTHRGDTNAIIRSHLGLIVPGVLPECGFQVGDQESNWQVGRVLPFCDAQPHSATNKTGQPRFVLIIDVMRPEYRRMQRKVCSTIITSHLLYELDRRIPFHKKASTRLLKAISLPIIFFVGLLLSLQYRLKFL